MDFIFFLEGLEALRLVELVLVLVLEKQMGLVVEDGEGRGGKRVGGDGTKVSVEAEKLVIKR